MADLRDLLGEALGGVAPSEDALERTIRLIRRRERRRRALVASVAVAVLVAIGAGALLVTDARRGGGPPDGSAAAPANPSPSTIEAPDPGRREVFMPPVRRERGRLVMPLTFPDGSTAELVYAPKLELAAMGVQPDVSFLRRDRPATRFALVFWFGQPDATLFEGDQPLGRYPTLGGGQAELWRAGAAPPPLPPVRYWLVFRLASWTVLAPVSTPAMAAEVVHGLDARETGGGYVVMEAREPYALSREAGEGGGPKLAIGDARPRPEEVDAGSRFRLITLRPSRNCRPQGISPSGQYASICLGTTGGGVALFAGIDGDRSFVEDVVAGLDARDVRIARH
jgi:hypothetical protein